jgi:PAS domain S-box-containing protein
MNDNTEAPGTPAPGSLEEQQANLRMAQRLLGIGIWTLDVATRHLAWSDNIYEIFDLTREEFGNSYEAYLGLVHPEDREAMAAQFAHFEASGASHFEFDHRIVGGKGRIVRVRGVGELTQTPKGKVLTGVVQDITKQVEADARLTRTLENMSDAFMVIDTHDDQWRFSFMNHHAEALLDRSRSELIGKPIWDVFPEAVGSRFQVEYERAVRTRQTVRFIEFYPPLDKWFEINAYPVPEGLAIYFHNITEHKRAEAAVKLSEERFRLVARASTDVIWDWDVRAQTLWWNENFTVLFGYDPAQLPQGPESWIDHIHPEDRDRVLHSLYEAVEGNKNTWTDTYRFTRADGQPVTVIDRGFVIRDSEGKAVRMLGSMIDISERLHLEERLRQSQKMEAVGQLTGGVAHDFNNLLTVILGNAEMLRERVDHDPKQRAMVDMTIRAAERGAELTHRLLAFARRQALEPKRVDLNQLLTGMDGMLRRTLAENIDIKLICGKDLWLADVDPGQLEVALLNLAINARDAMAGGGCLTIETRNTHLDGHYAQQHEEVVPGDYVLISVSDTGHGMSPEVVRHAFEPFFTTKEVGKGSGLGLSMVYGFVKQSGGQIKIYSEEGHGTNIKLYLPRTASDATAETDSPAVDTSVGGREHILVVEDDELVRSHLITQLTSLGYRVSDASNGPDALEQIRRLPDLDLLFTDIVMPGGLNGRQLADAAKTIRPNLKVLFTSGYTENAIVHHGRLDKGVHLLSKPYRRQEVAEKVRKVLDEGAANPQ